MLFRMLLWLGVVLLLYSATGQAQTKPSPHDQLAFEVVYQVPAMEQITVKSNIEFKQVNGQGLKFDIYYPPEFKAGTLLPAVVFINGYGNGPDYPPLKEWGQYRSWSRLVAAHGMLAITFDARQPDTSEDIQSLFAFLKDNGEKFGIDRQTLATWACSANVTPALPFLMEKAGKEIKGAVVYYGTSELSVFRRDLPVLFVRAGKDRKPLNDQIDRLLTRVVAGNAPWTVINEPAFHHGFDCLDETQRSVQVVQQTLHFLKQHLFPAPVAVSKPSFARQGVVYFNNQEWSAAVEAYMAFVAKNPTDGFAFQRLGTCQLFAKQTEDGVKSLETAAKLGHANDHVYYNLACGYSLLGKTELAMDHLQKAVTAGFRDKNQLQTDEDLASLRGDARFQEILAKMK